MQNKKLILFSEAHHKKYCKFSAYPKKNTECTKNIPLKEAQHKIVPNTSHTLGAYFVHWKMDTFDSVPVAGFSFRPGYFSSFQSNFLPEISAVSIFDWKLEEKFPFYSQKLSLLFCLGKLSGNLIHFVLGEFYADFEVFLTKIPFYTTGNSFPVVLTQTGRPNESCARPLQGALFQRNRSIKLPEIVGRNSNINLCRINTLISYE